MGNLECYPKLLAHMTNGKTILFRISLAHTFPSYCMDVMNVVNISRKRILANAEVMVTESKSSVKPDP